MLLKSAQHCPSPHYNERPDPSDISLLVIHNISLPPGQFGGGYVQSFFQGKLDTHAHPYFLEIAPLRVSSHLLIERTGDVIQFVPFEKRAWHAGVSQFEGRENCNDFSIGIELEGTDELPYEGVQYEQLIRITKILMRCYPDITPERVVGHCDIAPERKTDPGSAFDWTRLKSALI